MRRFLTPILGLFLLTSALLVCGCDNSALHPNIGLVRVFGELPDPLPVGSAEFDSAMTRICAVPARPCPPPQLLSNGEQYFPMLLADIARARSEVLLVTYILRDDRVGKAACQVLADAARRGVRVSILLDSIGSWNPGVPEMVAQLREAGASVSVINPLLGWTALRINNRCHVKLTVIDGSIGYVAGLNLSEKYAGGGLTRDQWRDTAIRVQGPVVEDIAAVFRHLEQESGRGFNRHRIPMPFVEETRRAIQEHVAGKGPWPPQNTAHEPTPMPSARVIFTRPGWFSHEFYKAMLLAVNSATESITMEYGYFIPDHPMTLALRNAAHRGVKVRIIMPDRLDVYLSKKISLESAQKLVRQGIELYAYTPGLLHSKTIVIDSMWSATGSANLNGRSFLLNYECTVAVLDPEFARQTLDVLDYDIMHCRKLSERDLLPANPLQFLVHKLLFFLKDHL